MSARMICAGLGMYLFVVWFTLGFVAYSWFFPYYDDLKQPIEVSSACLGNC